LSPSIVSIFPTAVLSSDLGRNFTDLELSYFEDIGKNLNSNKSNLSSNDSYILENKSMSFLKEFFETQIQYYLDNIVKAQDSMKLRITQSWINHNNQGQGHHRHYHCNSYLSGVFYIKTNEDDKIHFYNREYSIELPPPTEWNIWNSTSWWLEAKQYRLYIFPSTLQHGVETVTGKDTRISLSFNTFPVGRIGDPKSFTELVL
jgi:uncharacterized protein (TIGR02466 family)